MISLLAGPGAGRRRWHESDRPRGDPRRGASGRRGDPLPRRHHLLRLPLVDPDRAKHLREGNTDLDECPAPLAANHFYAIEWIDGHAYSIFPVGASLLAVPVVYALDATEVTLKDGKTEKLIACLITGLTAAVLYLVARRSLGLADALRRWNSQPADVDRQPSRLWDWRDLQFPREMRKPVAPP
jgi:hypothetical protein